MGVDLPYRTPPAVVPKFWVNAANADEREEGMPPPPRCPSFDDGDGDGVAAAAGGRVALAAVGGGAAALDGDPLTGLTPAIVQTYGRTSTWKVFCMRTEPTNRSVLNVTSVASWTMGGEELMGFSMVDISDSNSS